MTNDSLTSKNIRSLAGNVMSSDNPQHKKVLAMLFVRYWAITALDKPMPMTVDGSTWCFAGELL
jgi:hypothetical protein